MGTINYQTDKYKRRLVYEEGSLRDAVYFPREGVVPGMVYLGRIEDYHTSLKGYFVDLGLMRKGLYQGKEKLIIGKHYLFEVRKVLEGKHPILSRDVGLMGEYVIYRPEKESEVSSGIGEPLRSKFLQSGLKHVYFKRESAHVSFFKVEEEIRKLEDIYRQAMMSEQGERKTRLIYTPGSMVDDIPAEQLLEFEETLLRYRQNIIIEDDITYTIEMTKVGLVIDVNSGKSRESFEDLNDKAMRFISELLVTMNVGGIVLVDLIGSGQHHHFHDLMKLDKRITHVNISKLGILEISRRRSGLNVYDLPLIEVMADYIQVRLKEETKGGRRIKGIELSKRYRGIEQYLPGLELHFAEVFGYFQFF